MHLARPDQHTLVQPVRVTSEDRCSLHHSVDLPGLSRRTTALLEAGVPLTLLIDLTDPAGPRSQQAYTDEGGVTDWIPTPR